MSKRTPGHSGGAREAAAWAGYNLLFTVGFLVMLPKFLRRMARRGGYREGFSARFGLYPAELRATLAARRRLWIHAVSVGEVLVAARYMDELRRRHAGAAFVLTVTTSTGRKLAARQLGPEDVLLYFPLDFPGIVRRALEAIRPLAILLTEGELWPNLIRIASAQGIPVAQINGRMSASSFRGYRRLMPFARRVFARMGLQLMQTRGDAERVVALGAVPERVVVAGMAKYDAVDARVPAREAVAEFLARAGVAAGVPVLLGGSTWPGEEEALLRIHARLRGRIPGLRLVLVPRHAERGAEVEQAVRAAGFACVRRSRTEAAGEAAPDAVILADSTGELTAFCERADVVFMGKSLTCHGGQNVIEPALLGKAVVTGPHMENFPEVMDDLRGADAIRQVKDEAGLEQALGDLLGDAVLREGYGRRAREAVRARQGAVRRSVDLIEARFPGAFRWPLMRGQKKDL